MIKNFVDENLSNITKLFNMENKNKIIYTKEEAERVMVKYPDRIPVIVNRLDSASISTPLIDKNKYLVPCDLTVGQFQYVIRKRLSLKPHLALFMFVGNNVAPTGMLMSSLYYEHRDTNTNFLHFTYSMENTFG